MDGKVEWARSSETTALNKCGENNEVLSSKGKEETMRRFVTIASVAVLLFAVAGTAQAISVSLYADTAPNVYGSPNWASWWSNTQADVADGNGFVNMHSSTLNPGTLLLDPYDFIVYSTGDLGRRLHFIYWVPGETVSSLTAIGFQTNMAYDWEGAPDSYGWAAPSAANWGDYDSNGDSIIDGVVGTFGDALWATDDDALPHDTDGDPSNETNQADIDAMWAIVLASQTYETGMVRYLDQGSYQEVDLTLDVVPEPISMVMLGCLGAGMAAARRLRRKV